MAWGNHETVDRFHGALVLAERELNRRGASGVVALARERDGLILRHAAFFLDRGTALVVSLERLLVLLCAVQTRLAV